MDKLRAYWYKSRNFGDTLTPIILEHFLGVKVELAERNEKGKLLGIGSILPALRQNDIVWGSGYNREIKIRKPSGVIFLAVRGPMTRSMIEGDVPEVYGDPAILMTEIYKPKQIERHKVGFIPHYVDKQNKELLRNKGRFIIDIMQDPFKTIDEICSCDLIVSSSLHGIIAAEAYGIPAVWIKLSDEIIGGNFKFNDYFLGSGREKREPDKIEDNWNILPKPTYGKEKLLEVLLKYYGKN
jgi:pyruvyltransferase